MEYKTKDIGEAAALITTGIKIIRIDREGHICWFVFTKSDALRTSNNYWSGELIVAAKKYNDNLRSLKDRVFAQR